MQKSAASWIQTVLLRTCGAWPSPISGRGRAPERQRQLMKTCRIGRKAMETDKDLFAGSRFAVSPEP